MTTTKSVPSAVRVAHMTPDGIVATRLANALQRFQIVAPRGMTEIMAADLTDAKNWVRRHYRLNARRQHVRVYEVTWTRQRVRGIVQVTAHVVARKGDAETFDVRILPATAEAALSTRTNGRKTVRRDVCTCEVKFSGGCPACQMIGADVDRLQLARSAVEMTDTYETMPAINRFGAWRGVIVATHHTKAARRLRVVLTCDHAHKTARTAVACATKATSRLNEAHAPLRVVGDFGYAGGTVRRRVQKLCAVCDEALRFGDVGKFTDPYDVGAPSMRAHTTCAEVVGLVAVTS